MLWVQNLSFTPQWWLWKVLGCNAMWSVKADILEEHHFSLKGGIRQARNQHGYAWPNLTLKMERKCSSKTLVDYQTKACKSTSIAEHNFIFSFSLI
jgi:hypothetical protein